MNKDEHIQQNVAQIMRELMLYEKSQKESLADETFLTQAAEKVWVTYVLLLEKKYNVEIETDNARREFGKLASREDVKFDNLKRTARLLHVYHYEGHLSPAEAIDYIKEGVKMINDIRGN